MIVPKYWAEGRVRGRVGKRSAVVRRFGWSDTSQSDAQSLADQRAQEAFEALAAGQKVRRQDHKIAYNGAEGLPIREEILDRCGEAVITRNSYGAWCLNTPNVLFADLDFETGPGCGLSCGMIVALGIGAAALGWSMRSKAVLAVGLLGALFLGHYLATQLLALRQWLAGGPEGQARRRVERFLAARPAWRVRLYRTPAGLRVLAVHRTFDPHEPEVDEFFAAIQVDPVYAQMCRRQRCFRARLTAKPWRIGIADHMRPRPGVWPVRPERMAERQRWIADYERRAAGYAACQIVDELGAGDHHYDARAVQRIHDALSRAESGLPVA